MARIAPIAAAALLGLVALRAASSDTQDGQWRRYSADNGSTKYSPLDQINRSNVAQLKVAWRHPQAPPDIVAANPGLRLNNNYRATPIMVDGVLYASNGLGLAEAIDPQTGATIWVQKPGRRSAPRVCQRPRRRLLDRQRPQRSHSHVSQPLPLRAGPEDRRRHPVVRHGRRGSISRSASARSRAGTLELGAARRPRRDRHGLGDGRPGFRVEDGGRARRRARLRRADRQAALDIRVIPRAGEPGVETWENESWPYTGAGNVWSLMSADDELGYVYLPTTSVTNDMYGGHRLGDNLYSSSIVCLDAATGKRVWHFQTVHHDLFDYDNPAAPILADITVDGQRDQGGRPGHEAVVRLRARSRHRQAGLADRGAPVPASTVPGEKASPTQPISDEAAGVRSAGHHRRRSDRLHAGAARRGDGDLEAVSHRTGLHAAVDRRGRAGRQEGHDRAAGIGRRRGLDRRGVRSRDRDALRAVDDESVRRQPDSRRSEARRTCVIAPRRAS